MSYQKYEPKTFGKFSSSDLWSDIKETSHVNALLSGTKWGNINPDDGEEIEFLYYLSKYGDIYQNKYNAANMLKYEVKAMKNAMKAFSDVANISFEKTSNKEKANIKWALLDNEDSGGSLGLAYYPDGIDSDSGLATANFEIYEDYGSKSLKPGSFYFITFTHELGHALGLAHPHDTKFSYGTFPGVSEGSGEDFGDHKLNGSPWTVMSYNELNKEGSYNPKSLTFDGFLTNIGAFDIAAIQYLYGPNKVKNKGNNVYKLSNKLNGFQCIWDTGGIDVIDASEASGSATINLKNATLENQIGGGGFISQINGKLKGYTIAYETKDKNIECIIENAIGSNFKDQLIGNNFSNILNGGKGNDTLAGGKGKDKLIGGKGKDTFKLSTGKGYDLIKDFKDKEDKIFIGSIKKLKLKNKGKDVYIYKGNDLLAKAKGAKGDLSLKGKYLI